MKVFKFDCYTVLLDSFNRRVGCSIVFTTEEEAIKAFKAKSKEFMNKYIDEAISFHQCLGIDPNDFEYGQDDISFNLETENVSVFMNVTEVEVFNTVEDASQVYTIFNS